MHLGAFCIAIAQTLRLKLRSWTNCNLMDRLQLDANQLQLDPTELQIGLNQLQLRTNHLQPRD
jgi:hypothetical protein